MAEETTAAVEEERELASQPIPGLVRKYTIITGQGMLAQIIMVVLEGLVMGWGLVHTAWPVFRSSCRSSTLTWPLATCLAPACPPWWATFGCRRH